jgi:hypothetical protein
VQGGSTVPRRWFSARRKYLQRRGNLVFSRIIVLPKTVRDCGHGEELHCARLWPRRGGRLCAPVRRGDVLPVCPPLSCPAPHFPLAPSPSSSLSCFRRLRPRERQAAPADPPLREPSVSFDTSAAAAISPWPCLAVGSVEVGSPPYMARFIPCLRFPYSIVFIGGTASNRAEPAAKNPPSSPVIPVIPSQPPLTFPSPPPPASPSPPPTSPLPAARRRGRRRSWVGWCPGAGSSPPSQTSPFA